MLNWITDKIIVVAMLAFLAIDKLIEKFGKGD